MQIFVNYIGRFLFITQQYVIMYPTDKPDDLAETAIRDWQIVAIALDRIFFTVYLVIVAICISLYFPFPEKMTAPVISWEQQLGKTNTWVLLFM